MKWLLTLACGLAGLGIGLGVGVALAAPGAPPRLAPAAPDIQPPPVLTQGQSPDARVAAAAEAVAQPARGCLAEVRMHDGALAEYAHVIVYHAESRRPAGVRMLWTPAAPTLEIAAGSWLVSARSGPHGEYRVIHHPLEIPPDTTPDLRLELALQPTIVGTVRLPPMLENAAAHVVISRLDGELASPDGGRFEALRTVSGADPGFAYALASPGRYELKLRATGADPVSRVVEVAAGVTHVRLELPGPDASEYIVVRVHGPQGPVTRGVSIALLAYRGSFRTVGGTVSTLSDGAGEYWVPRSAFRQAEVARFALTVQSPYGQKEVPIDPESMAPVDVYFEAAAWLQVVINRPEGGPEVPVKLVHWKAGEPPGGPNYLGFDLNFAWQDRLRIGPLVPGDYEVAVHHMLSSRPNPLELDRAAVMAVAGETLVQLSVPRLYELKVEIPPEYQAHRLSVFSLAHPRNGLHVNVQGRSVVSVAPLRAGTHELAIENVGAMLVRVPHPEGRVSLDPQPFNALRVLPFWVVRGLDIGVRPDDLVLRIDGAPPYNERGQAVTDWLQREQTTWTILRDGATLQVSFSIADWNRAHLQTRGARVE